ncbi:uncharacterized protein LOC107371147 [Tetranychus urticae]|uniref:F-box domain-containing protein n=1 Tax=Tetranychus urticae TaxID=32264 RepID=T1JUW6_TETUR|nr:uncharacterized protein LOC107371147 [Tetranychus urticae]
METLADQLDSSLSQMTYSLLDLNDDCLHHIFSYIVNIRERLRLRRVCKRFAQIITSGLKTDYICLSTVNLLYPSELIDLTKKFSIKFEKSDIFNAVHKVYELHNEIFNFTHDDTQGFLDLPTGSLFFVVKFIMKSRYTRRSNDQTYYRNWAMTLIEYDLAEFKWILMRCPQLKILHVHGLHLDGYDLKYIPKTLEHLHLINTTIALHDFGDFLSTHGEKLQTLVYSRHTVIPLDSDRIIISQIEHHCPNLETLGLQLSYRSLTNFGSFKNLRNLTIEGCGRPKSFYETVLRSCPNLSECKFTFKTPPSKELLSQWYTEFPNLKKVQVELEETHVLAICPPPPSSF